MKFFIQILGCQFNKADGEKINQLLTKKGYLESLSQEKADLVIFLMCSVRQKSVDRAFNQIRNLKLKNKSRKLKIVATGCILKQDEKILKDMGVEIKNFKEIEKIPALSGLITIGKGCDNFCSYCVVPYTRGREKYKSQKAIIAEAKNLIDKGMKEITLIAQNVNSYPDFTGLLKKITGLQGNFKIRFLTNHPKDFSNELIEEMAQNPKIAKYVHLPFQAGDNSILKRMNRHYTRAGYLKLIAKIKKAIPEAVITTDIIVGFPGETKKQFEKTVEIMKKVKFKQAFIAKYSPRPGTAAFCLKDSVPIKEKKNREQILLDILKSQK